MTGHAAHKNYDDDYMMFTFKVKSCLRSDHHNWKHCPWRHPGEVAAQRRHPSVHKPTFCMNFKMAGDCAAGDNCPFSHNTFEMSLHPERYKTTLCNLGDKCNREICFFAHSHKELRTPEPALLPDTQGAAAAGLVDPSGGSFTSASGAGGAAASLPLLACGSEMVQMSSNSFTSPMRPGPSALMEGLPMGSQQQQEQQQLLLRQAQQEAQREEQQQQQQQQLLLQQSHQQQGMQQEMAECSQWVISNTAEAAPAPAGGGFFARVLSTAGNSRANSQQVLVRQDLCNFDSFTSQGSLSGSRCAASLQQQFLQQQQQQPVLVRQDLCNFDSFTSQGSLPGGSHNMAAALQQQQAMLLRQDLSNFDSFTSQGSLSGSQGYAAALQQQQAAAMLRQDMSNFDSFTSQCSLSGSSSRNLAASMQQQRDLSNFDSFTSQCSTSSQVSGPGLTVPVSPLLDRSQPGLQGSGYVTNSQALLGVGSSAGMASTGLQAMPRVFVPSSCGGPANAVVYQAVSAGPGGGGSAGGALPPLGGPSRYSIDNSSLMSPGAAGGSAVVYQLGPLSPQQQQAAALQQQVMQLQLRQQSSELAWQQ